MSALDDVQRSVWLAAITAALASVACAGEVDAPSTDEHVGASEQAIVAGTDDDDDDGVVALMMGGQIVCTGFLATSHVVVTAGHCVDQALPDTVYFGADPRTKKGTFIKVIDGETHPDFDPDTLANDIAIVALETRAPTQPLTIRTKAFDKSAVGLPLRLVGFGATQGGGSALRKHEGNTKVTSFEETVFRFQRGPSQTCDGDSGGPAFATIDGDEVVVGITSSGDSDCKAYGNDTRIDAFSSWVTDAVQDYASPEGAGLVPSSGCSAGRKPVEGGAGGGCLFILGCALAARVFRARR